MVEKLNSDFLDSRASLNNTIKYELMYNNYKTDVYYSKTSSLKNVIRLVLDVDGKKYLITEQFSEHDGKYKMNTYVNSEIYELLKFSLFYVDGRCKTNPFFEEIINKILNKSPILSPPPQVDYKYKNSDYNPYFETTVRTTMSDKMKERIKQNYIPALAHKIFEYCGDTLTLRFTSDPSKARDIEAYFDYK